MLSRLCFLVCAVLSLVSAPVVRAEPPASAASLAALQASAPADTVVETLATDHAALWLPEPFAPPVYQVDPRYKNRLTRAVSVYEKAVAGDTLTRRVTVHFEPDDRKSAVQVARLVARLLRLHRERFGRETLFPRGATDSHIWLVPSPSGATEIGGETRDANVYIFAASAIKMPVELVRTVAHEWGHLTLPAARGFTEPESDAAGFLGERLYLNYLFWDTLYRLKQDYPDDGTTKSELTSYFKRQIEPLRAEYAKNGVNSKKWNGDGTAAMNYYIGAVLDTDETIGSRLAGEALYSVTDTTPRAFLTALKKATAKALPKGIFVERRAWLYFERGRYRMDTVSGGGGICLMGAQTITATMGGAKDGLPAPKPGERRDGVFRVTKPGWYSIGTFGSLTEYRIFRTDTPAKP